MEKARRKIHFCVFLVVLTAIIMGLFYYYGQSQSQIDVSEGTLISNVGMGLNQLCQ